jgi:hypothetical protein
MVTLPAAALPAAATAAYLKLAARASYAQQLKQPEQQRAALFTVVQLCMLTVLNQQQPPQLI